MNNVTTYLLQFNKKLSKLLDLNFSKKVDKLDVIFTQKNGYSFYIYKLGVPQNFGHAESSVMPHAKPGIDIIGPEGEDFDSYILNVRFFIQNNDVLSIKTWNDQVNSYLVAKNLQTRANILRSKINSVLDSPRMNVKLSSGRIVLTAREIIDVYIYGEYAHSNAKKSKLFSEIGFGEGNNLSFILSMRDFLQVLKDVKVLNDEIIMDLRSQPLK